MYENTSWFWHKLRGSGCGRVASDTSGLPTVSDLILLNILDLGIWIKKAKEKECPF